MKDNCKQEGNQAYYSYSQQSFVCGIGRKIDRLKLRVCREVNEREIFGFVVESRETEILKYTDSRVVLSYPEVGVVNYLRSEKELNSDHFMNPRTKDY
jgi:hypothetical protein